MKKLSRKQQWIVVLIVSGVLLALPFAVDAIKVAMGKEIDNLGPKLEYIGKVNSGCDWWGTIISLGFCKSQYEYYFATDMSEDELRTYFAAAKLSGREDYSDNSDQALAGIQLTYKGQSEDFTLFYYNTSKGVISQEKLRPSVQKHVVSIRDFYYKQAQASVK